MVEVTDKTFITGMTTGEPAWIAPGEVSTTPGGELTQSQAIVEHKSESSEEAFSSDGEGQE